MRIEFTIPGVPVAQPRPKVTNIGGHPRMYDPAANAKANVRAQIVQYAPSEPTTDVLGMRLEFVIPRPASHYGTGKNANVLKKDAPVWVAKKPDLDNLVKFILDTMNQVFYRDDAQIVTLSVSKRYGITPLTTIAMQTITNNA